MGVSEEQEEGKKCLSMTYDFAVGKKERWRLIARNYTRGIAHSTIRILTLGFAAGRLRGSGSDASIYSYMYVLTYYVHLNSNKRLLASSYSGPFDRESNEWNTKLFRFLVRNKPALDLPYHIS